MLWPLPHPTFNKDLQCRPKIKVALPLSRPPNLVNPDPTCHQAFQSITDQDCLQGFKSKEQVHPRPCNGVLPGLDRVNPRGVRVSINSRLKEYLIFPVPFKFKENQLHQMQEQLQKVYLDYLRVFQYHKVATAPVKTSYLNQCQSQEHQIVVVPMVVDLTVVA